MNYHDAPGYHTPDGKGAWGEDWDDTKDVCFAGECGLPESRD
ncbi:MAG TPA: hypothetical protein VM223_11620 [Planctomycetota bacterium]|nr:hypothetical protein [Planctomycetota bacterium]